MSPITARADSMPICINEPQPLYTLAGKRVKIAMAAYNGSRFIAEQIESIQRQSFTGWTLLIRDDMSGDGTLAVVRQAAERDPRIEVMRDDLGNLGAIGNFGALMQAALEADADYLFFADQDDVWHPEKLATMLAAMRELELKYGAVPLLVHCDLSVVGEELEPVAESFARYSGLSPATADLGVLLCQNQVTGCACAINRALLELSTPLPAQVLMHDWWLALLAASAGKIGFVPLPLVKYRQHQGNVLGAISFGRRVKELLFSLEQWELRMDVIRKSFVQAAFLEARLQQRNIGAGQATLRQAGIYSRALEVPALRRVGVLREAGIGRPSGSSRLVFNLLLTLGRKRGGEGCA